MTVAFSAEDVAGVESVQVVLDGQTVASLGPEGPFSLVIDTSSTASANGSLEVLVRDVTGNTASDTVNFSIDNVGPDIQFNMPLDGDTVQELVDVGIVASDATGVAGFLQVVSPK